MMTGNKFYMIAEIQTFSGLDSYSKAKNSNQYKEIVKFFEDITSLRQKFNGTFVFQKNDQGYICTNTGYVRSFKGNRITQISKVTRPFADLDGYADLFEFVLKKKDKLDRRKYPSANYYNVWVDKDVIKYMIEKFKDNNFLLTGVYKKTEDFFNITQYNFNTIYILFRSYKSGIGETPGKISNRPGRGVKRIVFIDSGGSEHTWDYNGKCYWTPTKDPKWIMGKIDIIIKKL